MAIVNRQAVSFLIKAFKFLIFFGGLFILYQKLADTFEDHSLQLEIARFINSQNYFWIILLIIMALINWSLEGIKWQMLLKNLETMSFLRSLKSVLAGSSVTFINPYRSGAFLGKVLFLEEDHRVEASTLSILGGFAQSLTTLFIGLLGLFFIGFKIVLPETIHLLYLIGSISIIILLTFYFKLSFFQFILKNWSVTKKILIAYRRIGSGIRWRVLGVSILRYLIFTSQFAWLLKIQGFDESFFTAFFAVSIIYLVLAVIPSFWFGNIGIRETTAITLISGMMPNEASIILSSMFIWTVNLVIPAIAGSIFLVAQKEGSIQ